MLLALTSESVYVAPWKFLSARYLAGRLTGIAQDHHSPFVMGMVFFSGVRVVVSAVVVKWDVACSLGIDNVMTLLFKAHLTILK